VRRQITRKQQEIAIGCAAMILLPPLGAIIGLGTVRLLARLAERRSPKARETHPVSDYNDAVETYNSAVVRYNRALEAELERAPSLQGLSWKVDQEVYDAVFEEIMGREFLE
jgi:hypothetical protein